MNAVSAQGQILYDASEAVTLAERARVAFEDADLVVDSDSMLAIAAEDLKAVKGLQQLVEDRRTAITKPLNQALKQVNNLFRAPKEYLVQAERRLKDAILAHTTRQEQIAAAARARAEREMREHSTQLLAQEREQQQRANEAEQAANELLLDAQQAAARGDLQAAECARQTARAQLELAEQAREVGAEASQVAQVLSLPEAAAPVSKVEGVSGRTTYVAVVTDFMALVRAVAAGEAPLECLRATTNSWAPKRVPSRRRGASTRGSQPLRRKAWRSPRPGSRPQRRAFFRSSLSHALRRTSRRAWAKEHP